MTVTSLNPGETSLDHIEECKDISNFELEEYNDAEA
jgi:hypothetical protein